MHAQLSDDEITRYSRHILLDEVGGTGQARLRAARVLLVGAGGLGSPLLLYLAAAGVGSIGLIDDDVVELSNLQRQIAHTTGSLGQKKVHSAAAAARAINPDVAIEAIDARLTAANAAALVARYDIVCDGSDNFPTRFLVADACLAARRTLVSAAVLRFDGQLSTFKPHEGGPCYRCLHPAAPPDGTVPTCAEAGVLGAVVGVMGSLQATEVLKEVLGIGEGLSGRLLIWDALLARIRIIRLPKDPRLPGLRASLPMPPPMPMPAEAPLAILLLSGAYERAHYAFMLAAGAAAVGRPVLVFATNRGVHALCRDWGLDGAGADAGLPPGVAGLGELRDAVRELGVRLMACDAGLRIAGVAAEALLPGVEVAGIPSFLSAAGSGQLLSL